VTRVGRSTIVWLGGAAAMLMPAVLAGPALASAEPAAVFAPPQAPLLLTRTLQRPLPDGKAVVTRRAYAVRIVRDGAGYRVEGNLAETRVEAPPALAALAEIERHRNDTGLFPILLDANGMIVGGGSVQSDGSFDRAAIVAAQAIGGSGLPGLDMLQAQSFVQQLRTRAARSIWPADIFHPIPGKRSETRAIAMPDGGEGHVTIAIETKGAGSGGQLALLGRVVTTDLAGDTRTTREEWQLSRAHREAGR
jgi:hypothetical protein